MSRESDIRLEEASLLVEASDIRSGVDAALGAFGWSMGQLEERTRLYNERAIALREAAELSGEPVKVIDLPGLCDFRRQSVEAFGRLRRLDA